MIPKSCRLFGQDHAQRYGFRMSVKETSAGELHTKRSAPKGLTPDEMLARVLYRDGLMLVVDKPAGLSVHRGPKGGASLEDFFDALRYGLPRPPALAHRLDRDTSGCLVLGRHRKALAELGRLFKSGQVGKTYWAVVEGGPAEDEGRIDLPLGRRDVSRGWWMKHDPQGQPATTIWKVMGRGSSPSPRPNSGLPEFGRLDWPKSDKSDFGWGEGRGEGGSPGTESVEGPPHPVNLAPPQ